MKIGALDLSISSSGVVIEDVDDDFNVQMVNYFGFTSKRKLASDNIIYYNNKDFNTDYEKWAWMIDHILDWCKDCEYVAVEDYAYGKSGSCGLIFNLAEFEGFIKQSLFRQGKKLRFYAVNQIKKFFTEYGLSDKISMKQAFDDRQGVKPDLSVLPEVNNGHGVSPTSDVVDAFAICEFLRKELILRAGVETLHQQPKHVIECFNGITKANPEGLLVAPFVEKAK